MLWAPWHQRMSTWSQPFFPVPLSVIFQERLKIEVTLLLSANRKSYMPRWLAQQRMNLSDLACLKSTSTASRGISAAVSLPRYLYLSVTSRHGSNYNLSLDFWLFLSIFMQMLTIHASAQRHFQLLRVIQVYLSQFTVCIFSSIGKATDLRFTSCGFVSRLGTIV